MSRATKKVIATVLTILAGIYAIAGLLVPLYAWLIPAAYALMTTWLASFWLIPVALIVMLGSVLLPQILLLIVLMMFHWAISKPLGVGYSL